MGQGLYPSTQRDHSRRSQCSHAVVPTHVCHRQGSGVSTIAKRVHLQAHLILRLGLFIISNILSMIESQKTYTTIPQLSLPGRVLNLHL